MLARITNRSRVGLAFAFVLTATTGLCGAEQKQIRVAIFSDEGVTKAGIKQVEDCLPASQGFEIKTINAKQICNGDLKNFDVVIHGGGSASKQGETLGPKGRKVVKQFIDGGGGFIGICAGAYLASSEYEWSLGVLNAKVLDRPHWARGEGDVQLRMTSAGEKSLQPDQRLCTIHFENGPLLAPGDKKDLADYEQLATFETEMRKNDAPPGVMKGTTAIARGKYGKGRVMCFSPHPEKTPGREAFLQSAARWVAGQNTAN